jgi:hypothetical protein
VRALALRIFRIFTIAFAAYVAIAWAFKSGQLWLGYTIAVATFSVWFGFSLWRLSKTARVRREARWEEAIFEPAQRARAISEVQRAIKKLTPVRERARSEHAKLSVLLSELLDAQGDYPEAMAAVDGLALDALSAVEAGLVRHTRAVTHLRGSDALGALCALEGREPCGDRELDQRLHLLEAYARIELGEIERGLSTADEIAVQPGVEASVITEARVVRAAALDAQGRREEALVMLAALGRDALAPLSELGHPRVSALAQTVLDGFAA